MSSGLKQLQEHVRSLASPADAVFLQRFFKTGPGEYGEGDRFLGIRVPIIRRVVRTYRELPHEQCVKLLHSPWHEERLLALLLMAQAFGRGSAEVQHRIYSDYLAHTRFINNWDLVDSSAEHIVGPLAGPGQLRTIRNLAKSPSVWERRIAILSTFHWIRRKEFAPAISISHLLVNDPHDLIHKAVGWMLREIGKRDQTVEESFLREHCRTMPRTMLRYAIERFPEPLKKQYMSGEVHTP